MSELLRLGRSLQQQQTRPMDNRVAAACSLRGGMIVRIRHDPEKAEVLEAAGLRE